MRVSWKSSFSNDCLPCWEGIPLRCAGVRIKGAILSRERMAPLTPKRTRGALPLDPAHWQFRARRAARAAQCKCGVHGFAMKPYVSLRLAAAPYYRETRVTFAWRQTACRMRHCCARRIDECPGRRKLVRTSTRSAERQRMIEAETNRIATPNAAPPRAGSAIGKHCSSLSCSLAMEIFSGRV